jgi:hypothetical protein
VTVAARGNKLWRNRKDFERDLKTSYKASKWNEVDPNVPFGRELVNYQVKNHKPRLPKKVATVLSVLNDLVLDAIVWHHSFAMLLMNRNSGQLNSLERSLLVLQMKIVQDAFVVRNLMLSGFDIQAKNILRSIDEHVDLACYLCVKPEAAEEFVSTEDGETANVFWWRHVRGARKVIDSALDKIVKNDDSIKELRQFKSQEREMLSAAHHPSFLATTPIIVPYAQNNASMYMFGFPTEYSYRTGKLLFFLLAQAALFVGVLNEDIRRLIEEGSEELQETVERGRVHLGAMALRLAANWDAPIFDNSPAMLRYLRSLAKHIS